MLGGALATVESRHLRPLAQLVAVAGFLGVVILAAWLLRWVLGTMVELRRITTDLSILGWALGQAPADPPGAETWRTGGAGAGRDSARRTAGSGRRAELPIQAPSTWGHADDRHHLHRPRRRLGQLRRDRRAHRPPPARPLSGSA